jgi:hypothetical protein
MKHLIEGIFLYNHLICVYKKLDNFNIIYMYIKHNKRPNFMI